MSPYIYSLGLALVALASADNRPFPQSINFPGAIKPNHISQDSLNKNVQSYYDYWKTQYLRSNLNSLSGGYYVLGDATGSSTGESGTAYTELGTSEGQGYGMLLTVLMAGYDPNAQAEFDGLFKTARAYASAANSSLMGWIVADDIKAQGDFGSATDGDMDIAYALILAHEQWGSSGAVNYLAEAKKMIQDGLKASYVTDLKRLNLGDWQNSSTSDSRPSDWMFGHLKAYAKITQDPSWNVVSDTLYSLVSQLQSNYSPNTGLLPDFVTGNQVAPAKANFLEGPSDGKFYYNACRTPLRIAVDYAHSGDLRAKTALGKMVGWVRTLTKDTLSKFKAGYDLSGNLISGSNYYTNAFAAPMLAAAISDASSQSFLNLGWKKISSTKESYYEDSINLLSMLLISGNWWAPAGSSSNTVAFQGIENFYGTMRLYNSQGQLVWQGMGTPKQFQTPLNLAKGNYILQTQHNALPWRLD